MLIIKSVDVLQNTFFHLGAGSQNTIFIRRYTAILKEGNMYGTVGVFTLPLLFTLLTISLVSAPYLIKIASASLVNALDSKVKVIELVTKKAEPGQQDIAIHASGHFANNQIQNGSVTWIQGGLWDLSRA